MDPVADAKDPEEKDAEDKDAEEEEEEEEDEVDSAATSVRAACARSGRPLSVASRARVSARCSSGRRARRALTLRCANPLLTFPPPPPKPWPLC